MIRMKKALPLMMAVILGAGGALALDANEVAQLVRNGVQDTVIINMVQNQKLDRPLTAQEVLTLSAAGASGSLLEYMTRPEAVSASYVAPSAPIVVESPPVQVQAPTVVTTQPNVVVTSPPTVYYGSTCATPTYVYPRPVYRSRPSYSFDITIGRGWGGHRRGGHRWHGGPPRRHGGRRR